MIRIPNVAVYCALAFFAAAPALAQTPGNQGVAASAAPSYAAVAGQVVRAPLILDARIREATRLAPDQSVGVAPGRARFYIVADVLALIRGSNAMPARVAYVSDVLLDSRGRPPKLKKLRVLLFARPVDGRPDQIQLTGIDSQRNYLAETDALVRGITREAVAADAPPAITGVGNAFHVPGSLPGEGETQIFLTTESNDPVSLQVVRRPGVDPRWSVSLGDIVDDSAGPPAAGTLLWYRLACGLPRQLTGDALESDDPDTARIAAEDYAMVLRALGPCA
ncbi:MAG: hypothetical protein EOP62_16180 [Sphingomonadales bacterium]|nr:MAG: hypothetical protein EOP62_16180 [Sphingomonadales bacterium]